MSADQPTLRNRLLELLEPVVAGLGYELWELEFANRSDGGLLRIYIDVGAGTSGVGTSPDGETSQGGISLDDCERVSHAVSEALDAADPISVAYTLEVSSPGLDRILRRPAHFERFIGELVKFEMVAMVGGRKRFSGRVLGVTTNEVTLDVAGERLTVPLADVHKARLVPQFD
jgi:ribosome maturation factor RimP